jgi:hypothetical protein
MRVTPTLAAAGAALVVAGCAGQTAADVAPAASSPAPSSASAPPEPPPARSGTCPYLDTGVVARANGQHVGKVRLSAGRNHAPPTCFFYRGDGRRQLTVRPFAGDARTARAVVNAAAPVATSNRAEDPPGWQGGSEVRQHGAVYAVADRHGHAIVVTTNQRQTIKAKQVALRAIKKLHW